MSSFGHIRKAIRKVRTPVLGLTGLYFFGPRLYKSYQEWEEEQKSPSKSVLIIPFHRMRIVERKSSNFDDVGALLNNDKNKSFQVEVKKLVETIHKAANDPRITALYGDFGLGQESQFSVEGLAQVEEIRNAIRVFNESHRVHTEPNYDYDQNLKKPTKGIEKQSIAYAESFDSEGTNPQYLLSSQFSKIAMKDRGNVNLYGMGVSTPFLKKALQKYGIKVHVFKHGEFKNAPNTFTESTYTKEHLQNTTSLLNAIDESLKSLLAATRSANEQYDQTMLKAIRDYGTLTSENAKEVGLIDIIAKINPLHDLIAANKNPEKKGILEKKWKGQLDFDGFRATKEISYEEYSSNSTFSIENLNEKIGSMNFGQMKKSHEDDIKKEKIALIYANGAIDSKMAGKIINDLKKVKEDDAIKCVILRVNSPGGSAMASEAIHAHCKDLSKPVICSMGNYAASGGYYIASASERIFAMPTTITGSIGVFGVKLDFSNFFSRYGVNFGQLNLGPHSNSLSLVSPMTRKVEQNMNRNVDNIYKVFKTIVSEGRDMTMEEVEDIAKGKVWTGDQAKHVGLIDEIGGLERAIGYAKRKYTKQDDTDLIEFRRQGSFLDVVSKFLSQASFDELNHSNISNDPVINYITNHVISSKSYIPLNPKSCGFVLSVSEEDAVEHMIRNIFDSDK